MFPMEDPFQPLAQTANDTYTSFCRCFELVRVFTSGGRPGRQVSATAAPPPRSAARHRPPIRSISKSGKISKCLQN